MSEKVCANCACYYKERCRVRYDLKGNPIKVQPDDVCDAFSHIDEGYIHQSWCLHCNRYTEHRYLYTYVDDDGVIIQVDKCLVCGNRKHW